MTLDDFDYALPEALIAQHPASERSASRLLDGRGRLPVDRVFSALPELLNPGDLLVFNDTRVIKARLLGRKASGGAVELLVERVLPPGNDVLAPGNEVLAPGNEVLAHVRASKPPRAGAVLRLADAFDAEVLGRGGPDDSLFRLRFSAPVLELLDRHGHVPLPPYITHGDDADDERRYQTVFADRPGAVAAPTAALHFDEALLERLAARGVQRAAVTLHVGAGTFQPVRVARLSEHRMHSEWFEVSPAAVSAVQAARERGGRVVAVGTTSLRALETAARGGALGPCTGETDIFITPGFEFRVADLLVTNFHLPKSTLLMLVSAFAGHTQAMALYRHAIESRYRFFSYGDAMLLARNHRGGMS